MKLFLISPRNESQSRVEQLVKENFPCHMLLPNRGSSVWVLAAPANQTPSNIASKLDMRPAEQSNFGLVVQIGEYDGYDFRSLWQQFEAWLDERREQG